MTLTSPGTRSASGSFSPVSDPRDRALLAVVALVAAAAWVALHLTLGGHGGHAGYSTAPGQDPTAAPVDHSTHQHHVDAGGAVHHDIPVPSVADGAPLLTVAGWLLMVVAMMLPPALPLLSTLRRLVAGHRRPAVLVGVGAAVFLAVWAECGLAFWAGDLALDALAARVPAVRAHPEVVAGVAAVAAGLYQFSPAKTACLRACRSPRSVALASWQGRRPAAYEVAAIGVRYGLICVGCCWALMLLTFAIGTAAMAVMVVLSLVMLGERLVPRVRIFVPVVAVAAVALGAAILAGLLRPGLL